MSVEATQKQPDNGSMNQNLGWKVNKIFFKKYLLFFTLCFSVSFIILSLTLDLWNKKREFPTLLQYKVQ